MDISQVMVTPEPDTADELAQRLGFALDISQEGNAQP
jgi:hypothetical protein